MWSPRVGFIQVAVFSVWAPTDCLWVQRGIRSCPCPGILFLSWGIRYLSFFFLIIYFLLKCNVHTKTWAYLRTPLNKFSSTDLSPDQAVECYSHPGTPILPSSKLPIPLKKGSGPPLLIPAQIIWPVFELYINELMQPAPFCVLLPFSTVCLSDLPMLLPVVVSCLFSLLDPIPFDDYSWFIYPSTVMYIG